MAKAIRYVGGGSSNLTESVKEEAKKELAIKLLKYTACLIALTIIEVGFLIWFGKLEPDTGITFILAVSNVFSGLLGAAITYYFSSGQKV